MWLRNWPVALQLLFMRTVALLPLRAIRWLGAGLGTVLWPLARERRQITLRNLELCFPNKSLAERLHLARSNFRNTAIGFMETAKVWFSTPAQLAKHVEIEGLEHLQAAAAKGKGVLVLAFHLTDLELGAVSLARYCQLAGMYRPHANPLFEQAMRSGRERHFPLIPRDDVRAMLRWLKSGGCVWYAADQDYGAQHSVFAPFFGIPAATITATSRFAKLSGATVLPFTHVRTARGIKLILHPPLTSIPSGDDADDAATANAFLEQWLRAHPADYLWLHRRFKTRPAESAALYPARRARYSGNEISGKRLDKVLKTATRLSTQSDASMQTWSAVNQRLLQTVDMSIGSRLRQQFAKVKRLTADQASLPVTVLGPTEVWYCRDRALAVWLFDPAVVSVVERLRQPEQQSALLPAIAHQLAILHAANLHLAAPDLAVLALTGDAELVWLPFSVHQVGQDSLDSRLNDLSAITRQCAAITTLQPETVWQSLSNHYFLETTVPAAIRRAYAAKPTELRSRLPS
ncbi:MAG: LpxL/LpxP family Kdo(2)-lipid IV(A) lauroyl/palmitoleoyl acyltransferase [Permianibacter sp.]